MLEQLLGIGHYIFLQELKIFSAQYRREFVGPIKFPMP
jgi:hypothetical protein